MIVAYGFLVNALHITRNPDLLGFIIVLFNIRQSKSQLTVNLSIIVYIAVYKADAGKYNSYIVKNNFWFFDESRLAFNTDSENMIDMTL